MALSDFAYPDEVWKPEVLYGISGVFVSSHGRVWRDKYEFLGVGPKRTRWQRKPEILYSLKPSTNGYVSIIFKDNGKQIKALVHRLVCAAFHGLPPSEEYVAAHFDGVRSNNHYQNLRWCTQQENLSDKVRHGTAQVGTRHAMAKLSEDQVIKIRKMVSSGMTQKQAGAMFGVTQSNVSLIVMGKHWSHL